MKRYLVAGNWKMNKTNDEATTLAKEIVRKTADVKNVDIVICPPFTALAPVYEITKNSNVHLGAQNMFYEDEGAYTGEISGKFLKAAGCEFVIIGHSERRIYFKETDAVVNKKIKKALSLGLIPIVCVGETLEEREMGKTEEVIKREVLEALKNQSVRENFIFAYEPIWAIGTGKTALPEDANKIHKFIKNIVEQEFNIGLDNLRVLYGGSVKPKNAAVLIEQPAIDGSLVGGASLNSESFAKIIKITEGYT
ncbi:MAG: triose-phosphate isomerase [Candidatus Cloacimonas sp. 4484_209]|nr:MAG: triose-phosphate isomerase [Candidatus Cloacimonas sp. 4484_209]